MIGFLEEDRRQEILRTSVLVGGAALVGGTLAWVWSRNRDRRREAPGGPGDRVLWSPSDKSGIGTALTSGFSPTCPLWFTLTHGAVSEVFYPQLDHPVLHSLSLFVTDGRSFTSDERCDADHRVEAIGPEALLSRMINTCDRGRYQIEKVTIAHPRHDCVLQQIRFTPLQGSLEDYRLYALMNPHLGLRQHIASHGWIGTYKGRSFLFASRDEAAMALGTSAPWRNLSVGYIGASDGWTDLRRHARLTRTYDRAGNGNVLLTGELDLRACGGTFTLALGLGFSPPEAGYRVLASLADDFEPLQDEYVRGWRQWQSGLLPLDDSERVRPDLYRTSTAVLRTHESKTVPGAAVASLSIPWGQARDDGNLGRAGYHLVWPRDLVEIAGGYLAAGAVEEARRVLDYLQVTQEDDGHWPQNMWVSGEIYWSGIQMGETALPVLLVDLLDREGLLSDLDHERLWPMVRKAVEYLLVNGPSSQQDRWENATGFTPFTLSAIIASLLIAADLADRQGESRASTYLRETADAWNDAIEYWTYVKDTDLAHRIGVSGYYLRIAPTDDEGEPIKNAGRGQTRRRSEARSSPSEVVSPDALAYVRFGLRAADDPRILDTIRVVDSVLKIETPFSPSWRRYNTDAYGEKTDGTPFDGTNGIGRAWPLLTGERAHYELAAGRRSEAERLLRAFEEFAGDGGFFPEQIWDSSDIPSHSLYLGRPSGSAMPLAWAHAEYLKLVRSLHEDRVYDRPAQTLKRYVDERVVSPHVIWRPNHQRRTMPAGKILRIALQEPALILWESEGNSGSEQVPTRDSGLRMHYADLPTASLPPGSRIRFSAQRIDRDHRAPSENLWMRTSVVDLV